MALCAHMAQKKTGSACRLYSDEISVRYLNKIFEPICRAPDRIYR